MSFLDAINAELNECLNKIDFKALYDAVVNINLDTIKAIAVHLKDHVHNIRPEHINNAFEEALKHVANDPVQAAIYLVWTIILIFPGIVTGPLLALLGLSEIGPVAGKYHTLRLLGLPLLRLNQARWLLLSSPSLARPQCSVSCKARQWAAMAGPSS